MRVGLIADPCFENHETGDGHPETPERLARFRARLAADANEAYRRIDPRPADDVQLHRVHTPEHVAAMVRTRERERTILDGGDTVVGARSEEIARLAAGSVMALAREVARGSLDRGFAAVRPPGHHAERDRAMGFCLYNHVAVAAADLTATAEGISKVLIVDWDAHHGNGTQHIFEESADVFYFSLHQWPFYPGTGAREERGRGAGEGTTLNCPLPAGSGDREFLGAIRDELIPAARRFDPDFVLISAGFDAHRADPLAQLEVSTAAFGEATAELRGLAERHAGGRLVSVLEGGYDLDALSESMLEHLRAMR